MTGFGCVLDMDDTLYLERDYVRSGFRAVAEVAGGQDGPSVGEVEDLLWAGFTEGSRGSSFDDLLERFPTVARSHTVATLVATYRDHTPAIALVQGMASLVDDLAARGIALAVVSDGAESGQAAKAKALEVSHFADPVVLTDTWGREWWKPHPRAFEFVAQALGLPPERLVYVGDNPAKDFVSPCQLGWSAIRLRMPGQLHEGVEVTDPGVLEARSVAELHAQVLALAQSDRPRRT